MGKLDSTERAALFICLRQQFDAFSRRVQSAFTTAGEDTLREANADVFAHRAARQFLIFACGGNYYEDHLDSPERSGKTRPDE